jgi:hypothetical protein
VLFDEILTKIFGICFIITWFIYNKLKFSLPVKAALPCQYGTVNSYQNGSVESCTIENNVDIRIGSLVFPCKQGYSIFFDKKAQFKSCVISTAIKIITGNTVETCSAEFRVEVSNLNNSKQSVTCYRSY